jgi:hypothetical protein
MIERLNFFDFYAYLLPGLTWLLLVLAPHFIMRRQPPPTDWTSALAGVVTGYVLGHLLYQASRIVPWFETKCGPKHESQLALGREDRGWPAIKKRVGVRAYEQWGISLAVSDDDDTRQLVFELARAFLQANNRPSYAEQMQGMQCLVRGLAGAFFLASASCLGWCFRALLAAAPVLEGAKWFLGAVAAYLALLAIAGPPELKKAVKDLLGLSYPRAPMFAPFFGLALASVIVGYRLAALETGEIHWVWLLILAGFLFFAGHRFKLAIRGFAQDFARHVFVSFAATGEK